jgi:hypothetical protein
LWNTKSDTFGDVAECVANRLTTKFEDYFRSFKPKEKLGECYWFPSEKELNARGIQFQKIVQKPGDAIYNGYGSYHWVLNPVSTSSFHLTLVARRHTHRLEPRVALLLTP